MKIGSECKELISMIIAMPDIACRKRALVRVGRKQEKTSSNRNDVILVDGNKYLASKINARAAFWDTFYSMGVPLGVFCIFRRRHFLNALLNVSDQDGKLHAVYTSQKL